jgi:hypothetical protein
MQTVTLKVDHGAGGAVNDRRIENKNDYSLEACRMRKEVCNVRAVILKQMIDELMNEPDNNDVNPEILYEFMRAGDD